MIDYNILNRALFEEKQLVKEIVVPINYYEYEYTIDLGDASTFWLSAVSWKLGYFDVLLPRATRNITDYVTVTVLDLFESLRHPPPKFTMPKPLKSKIVIKIKNPNVHNNMQLRIEFSFDGTLITQKPGQESLSYKETIGYLMLPAEKKGELILQEAMFDKAEDRYKKSGLPLLSREALFTGHLLPNGNTFHSGNLLPNNNAGLLLETKSDPKKERAMFIGDVISCSELNISNETVQKLADHMISNGWRKSS